MPSTIHFPTRSNGVLVFEIDAPDTALLFGKTTWLTQRRASGDLVLRRYREGGGWEYLHRLIAIKHCPRPSPEHTHVLFANGNPYDYTRANLLWATSEQSRELGGSRGYASRLAAKRQA